MLYYSTKETMKGRIQLLVSETSLFSILFVPKHVPFFTLKVVGCYIVYYFIVGLLVLEYLNGEFEGYWGLRVSMLWEWW